MNRFQHSHGYGRSRTKALLKGSSSLAFGRKSAPPAWRDEAGLAMLLPRFLDPESVMCFSSDVPIRKCRITRAQHRNTKCNGRPVAARDLKSCGPTGIARRRGPGPDLAMLLPGLLGPEVT